MYNIIYNNGIERKIVMKKTFFFTLLTILLLAASGVAADETDVAFMSGSREIYKIENGGINAKISLQSEQDVDGAMLVTALFDGSRLTDIDFKTTDIKTGANSLFGNAVAVGNPETEKISVMLFDSAMRPLVKRADLGLKSRDTSFAAVAEVDGRSYASLMRDNSGVLYLPKEADKTKVNITEFKIGEGAAVSIPAGETDFTDSVTYTVTSESGEQKTYVLSAYDGMTLSWDEQFTGAEITGDVGSTENGYESLVEGSSKKSTNMFVPTNGTWNGGEFHAWKYGYWNQGRTDRKVNVNPYLEIVEDGEHGDVLKIETNKAWGPFSYSARVPENADGSGATVPTVTDRVLIEYDMKFDDFDEWSGNMQANILKFANRSGFLWCVQTSKSKFNLSSEYDNTLKKTIVYKENLDTNTWYHVSVLLEKTESGSLCNIWLDGEYLGSKAYNVTPTLNNRAFEFDIASSVKSVMYWDNTRVMSK